MLYGGHLKDRKIDASESWLTYLKSDQEIYNLTKSRRDILILIGFPWEVQ